MNIITSVQNPIIKDIRSLKEKKYRQQNGLFFIEGSRFVEEALKEEQGIKSLIIKESFKNPVLLDMATSKGIRPQTVSDKVFKEVSETDNPQGILAVVSMKRYSICDVCKDDCFLVILDSLQDPGNMGTIIRTADAAGASGVIVSGGCVDVYNPKVLRSTMGSIFHVPVVECGDLKEGITELKKNGIRIFASHLDGRFDYYDTDFSGGTAFIVGNEANGVAPEIAELSDAKVRIPMPGRAESLNAAVAASLLMYEIVRQRRRS